MRFHSLKKISAILTLCALPLSAAPDIQDLLQDIANYPALNKEQKTQVLSDNSHKFWQQLSPAQRSSVQVACYQASQKLIGKNPKGALKVVREDGGKRILKIAGDYLKTLPVDQTPAHPRAGDLYGEIPPDAQRVERTITIDPRTVRWHATGLYAAPGDLLELTFPENWVGKGLKIQVSGHRDNISPKKDLSRLPASPARTFPVDQATVKVAAAFGGALYIDTGGAPRQEEPIRIKVTNALPAPYFILGKTTPADWKESLRLAPAPYAELVTDRIALSLPSAWIRGLEDPTALLQYWDKVVALHDELGGLAHTRHGPERVNVDVQISAGLFHAGYPAQGPQQQCRGVVDLQQLQTQGNWGWFHEMGHEAQRRPDKAWGWNNPYTFDNSIEVTVNLFTAHAMDRLHMPKRGGWSWTATPAGVTAQAHKALATKKKYAAMGYADKLSMYLQIRDQFGWGPIQEVLTSYSKDQDSESKKLPKTDQEKRDAFHLRISQATKHNLAPFLQDLWGLSLSPAAVAKTKNLPVWIPQGFDKYLSAAASPAIEETPVR